MVEEAAATDQRNVHDASHQHKEWLRASISARDSHSLTTLAYFWRKANFNHTAKTKNKKTQGVVQLHEINSSTPQFAPFGRAEEEE